MVGGRWSVVGSRVFGPGFGILGPGPVAGHENDLPSGRSKSAHGEQASCALRNEYQDVQVGRNDSHSVVILTRSQGRRQVPFRIRPVRLCHHGLVASRPKDMLRTVRTICLALPEVTERPSHGTPTFFVRGKKAFVYVWLEGHHGNHFPHLWCAAEPGVQEILLEAEPGTFFRPPYLGPRGWVGVRLDAGIGRDEIGELCEDAYRVIAPQRLVDELEAGRG